jgi:hypothetical protein
MGEIKSALELAMERSKKYVISDEERERIKEKEILQKATGLFHRYQENHLSIHETVREIERMDERTRGTAKEILLSQCAGALSLEEDPERLFSLMESIKNQDLHPIRQEFQSLSTAYHEEKEKARQKMGLHLAEILKKAGIYGDAIVPNVEGNDHWKEVLDSLNHSYSGKLEEIKEALKKLYPN